MTSHLAFLNTSQMPVLHNNPFVCLDWCQAQLLNVNNQLTSLIGFSALMQIFAIFSILYFPKMNPYLAKHDIIVPYHMVYRIGILTLWFSLAFQVAFLILSQVLYG